MSGGSLDYAYSKLAYAVEEIEGRELTPLQQEFAAHLRLVVKALRDLEWVWSGDCGKGDEELAILAVLDRKGES